MRPTAALAEEGDPFSNWTPHDYRLVEAVKVLNRDTCNTCGNPVWLCHTTHSGVEFEIMSSICYAKAELDDYEKKPGNDEAGAGESRYAKAIGIKNEDGSYDPLPSRAEALAKIKNDVIYSP